MTADEVEQFKSGQRQGWEEGDYRQVATRLEPAARRLVDEASVLPGQRVLDVATGAGSVAVAAGQAGGDVVGVDLTDAWFDEARVRARTAGVEVDLRVADAEALPFDEASFDVVLSSFGMIFAPRHEVVAAELARVCRPAGTVAFSAWTPGGANDRMMSTIIEQLPAPPAFVTPFIRWGDPDHVRGLFAGHGIVFRFGQADVTWEFPSVEAADDFLLANSGPLIAARRALESLGRWEEAHAAMRATMHEVNEAGDGTCRLAFDYLLAVGTREG